MVARDDRAILVLNAGSSSIKFCIFRLVDGQAVRDLRGQVSGLGTVPRFTSRRDGGPPVDAPLGTGPMSHAEALDRLLAAVQAELGATRIVGVGHRVVHGGLEFMAPTAVDAAVLQRLDQYVPLAPLHQPHNLAAIRAMLARLPGVPEIACFDTAFHRTVPDVAQRFALPPRFAEAGVRRYGFHGLSYEYIASQLPAVDARAAAGRTVVFHLGNGSSMCALQACRSIATTMGFTAVDGLPMGTRCGAMDPGVVLFLMDEMKLGPRDIERLIYHESGLLGMSGVSSDVRDLLASREPAAALALDVFVYRATANSARSPRRWAASTLSSLPPASAKTRLRFGPHLSTRRPGWACSSTLLPTIGMDRHLDNGQRDGGVRDPYRRGEHDRAARHARAARLTRQIGPQGMGFARLPGLHAPEPAMKITVAATQFACTPNAAENVARAESMVRQAAAKGAQVILLQELFETPYFCKDHFAGHFALAHPLPDNPVVRRFQGLAKELGVVLPISVFERANNAYYNSLAMIDADGEVLGTYRKSHIPEGPGYHENSISRRATRDSRSGRRASARSAWASAGTSGSRKPRAAWR